MKIDVEGAEGGVIAGAKKIIEKNKDMKLHFEFNPSLMRLFGTDPKEYLASIVSRGFRLYDIRNLKRDKNELETVSAEELLSRCEGNRSAEVFAKRGV